jgi:hypothetical protein
MHLKLEVGAAWDDESVMLNFGRFNVLVWYGNWRAWQFGDASDGEYRCKRFGFFSVEWARR